MGPVNNRNTNFPPPLQLLIQSIPGVGKSFLIKELVTIGSTLNTGHIQRISHTGIASVLINGATLCSVLSIDATKSIQEELSFSALVQLRKRLQHDKLSMILLDEISCVDCKLFAAIATRLRQVTGNIDLPLWGFAIIILGDFSQLPPVQSSTLPYATMQVVSLSKQQEDTLTTSSLLPATRPHNKPARKKDQGFLLRARKHHETVRKTKSIKNLSQYGEFQVGKPKDTLQTS